MLLLNAAIKNRYVLKKVACCKSEMNLAEQIIQELNVLLTNVNVPPERKVP